MANGNGHNEDVRQRLANAEILVNALLDAHEKTQGELRTLIAGQAALQEGQKLSRQAV